MNELQAFEFGEECIGIDDSGLAPFQADFLAAVRERKFKVIFMDAPTGSGKTHSFFLPSKEYDENCSGICHTLISEPTNAIIEEIYGTLTEKTKNSTDPGIKRIRVGRLTGKDPVPRGGRQSQVRDIFKETDVLVSTPDILSLYVAGNYLERLKAIEGGTYLDDALRRASVIIFDEYHSYDDASLGKILSILLISMEINDNITFVFSSATPSGRFKELIRKYVPREKIGEIKARTDALECGVNSRKVRGRMKLIITDSPIADGMTDILDDLNRLLQQNTGNAAFIFNSIRDAENFYMTLWNAGIKAVAMDGYGRKYSRKERVTVGTSSIELGINLPELRYGHVEMGFYLESVLQRLGRFSRGGDVSTVYLHVPENWGLMDEVRKINTGSYSEFVSYLIPLVEWKWRNTAMILNTSRLFTEAVRMSLEKKSREVKYDHRPGLLVKEIDEVLRKLGDVEIKGLREALAGLRGREPSFDEWWDEYFRALGYFRGSINHTKLRVPVFGEDGKKNGGYEDVTYDIVHIKRWVIGVHEDDTLRLVEYRTTPNNDVSVSYSNFNGDPVAFRYDELDDSSFRKKWADKMEKFLFHVMEIPPGKDTDEIMKRLKFAMSILTRNTLKMIDKEVGDGDNGIFL